MKWRYSTIPAVLILIFLMSWVILTIPVMHVCKEVCTLEINDCKTEHMRKPVSYCLEIQFYQERIYDFHDIMTFREICTCNKLDLLWLIPAAVVVYGVSLVLGNTLNEILKRYNQESRAKGLALILTIITVAPLLFCITYGFIFLVVYLYFPVIPLYIFVSSLIERTIGVLIVVLIVVFLALSAYTIYKYLKKWKIKIEYFPLFFAWIMYFILCGFGIVLTLLWGIPE
ncbi:MAG: hypothetical protein PVF58_22845 [Candidatus Methanofastidiosia archaeon]|jgi:hypothetical protein